MGNTLLTGITRAQNTKRHWYFSVTKNNLIPAAFTIHGLEEISKKYCQKHKFKNAVVSLPVDQQAVVMMKILMSAVGDAPTVNVVGALEKPYKHTSKMTGDSSFKKALNGIPKGQRAEALREAYKHVVTEIWNGKRAGEIRASLKRNIISV